VIIFIYTVEAPVDGERERTDRSEIPGSLAKQLRLHWPCVVNSYWCTAHRDVMSAYSWLTLDARYRSDG